MTIDLNEWDRELLKVLLEKQLAAVTQSNDVSETYRKEYIQKLEALLQKISE